MPQGNFTNKRKKIQIPGKSKKPKKDLLKKKPGQSTKKKNAQESKKLRVQLQKAINAKIEEDCKAIALKSESSFRILKGVTSDKKKK